MVIIRAPESESVFNFNVINKLRVYKTDNNVRARACVYVLRPRACSCSVISVQLSPIDLLIAWYVLCGPGHRPVPVKQNSPPIIHHSQPSTHNPPLKMQHPQSTTHNPAPVIYHSQCSTHSPPLKMQHPQSTTHNPAPTIHDPNAATCNL